jgi:hypothetical protein
MSMAQPDERSWHFKQLRSSLQQLAASGSPQNPLFPDLHLTADELALHFDHWATVVRDEYSPEMSDEQRASLAALDRMFARMSRDAAEFDAEIWTDAAVKTSAHWASIRQLAGAALEAFGWIEEGVIEANGPGSELIR